MELIFIFSDNNRIYTFRVSNYDRNVENTYVYYEKAMYSFNDYFNLQKFEIDLDTFEE